MKPKVGDTVLIKAIVARIGPDGFYIKYLNTPVEMPELFDLERIVEIHPAPPKVGEEVIWDADPGAYSLKHASGHPHTLVHIHADPMDAGKRVFGVVAYKGDIPQSIKFDRLRRASECAD